MFSSPTFAAFVARIFCRSVVLALVNLNLPPKDFICTSNGTRAYKHLKYCSLDAPNIGKIVGRVLVGELNLWKRGCGFSFLCIHVADRTYGLISLEL